MKKTEGLKVKFLGIIPEYKLGKTKLSPEKVSAFSGLLTFRGDSMESLVKEAKAKKQDIEKKAQFILRKSSLRGHASMATMPVFCFTFEASKMIGSMITGIMFSSALMHSGRRANVTVKDIVYPGSILKNKEALVIYQEASKKNINTFNALMEMSGSRDEVSKILHYGTYGTGIITLPAESLATFLREYELEKDWMPEEAGFLIKKLEKELKKMGIASLYATRSVAPKNTYPFPNIFKDPREGNLVRDLLAKHGLGEKETLVVDICNNLGPSFQKRSAELLKKQAQLFKNLVKLKKEWPELLNLRRKLIRDFGVGLNLRTLSRVSWRIWRDKKRHRTAPVVTESIYYCIKEALPVFKRYNDKVEPDKGLNDKEIKEVDRYFAIPPLVRKNKEALNLYLKAAFGSLIAYDKLLKAGIRESDAVFIIPRAFRIAMVQEYNLFNIIDGYYSLRSCLTADEQVYRQTRDEIKEIKNQLDKKGLQNLSALIEPKCVVAGFCPEERTCGYIKKFVKSYNENFHQKMKEDLEDRFQKKLSELNI